MTRSACCHSRRRPHAEIPTPGRAGRCRQRRLRARSGQRAEHLRREPRLHEADFRSDGPRRELGVHAEQLARDRVSRIVARVVRDRRQERRQQHLRKRAVDQELILGRDAVVEHLGALNLIAAAHGHGAGNPAGEHRAGGAPAEIEARSNLLLERDVEKAGRLAIERLRLAVGPRERGTAGCVVVVSAVGSPETLRGRLPLANSVADRFLPNRLRRASSTDARGATSKRSPAWPLSFLRRPSGRLRGRRRTRSWSSAPRRPTPADRAGVRLRAPTSVTLTRRNRPSAESRRWLSNIASRPSGSPARSCSSRSIVSVLVRTLPTMIT